MGICLEAGEDERGSGLNIGCCILWLVPHALGPPGSGVTADIQACPQFPSLGEDLTRLEDFLELLRTRVFRA